MPRVGRKRIHDRDLPARVYKRRGKYYFVPVNPQDFGQKWVPLGDTLHDALVKYAALVDQPSGTLAGVWQRYQLWMPLTNRSTGRPYNGPRTVADKEHYWQVLKPVFGHCRPDDVEPRDIMAYLQQRELDGAGVQGNKEIALLSHMYTKALEWDMTARNPCQGIRRNPTGSRNVDVSLATFGAWLEFAPPLLALYSELLFMTGMRAADPFQVKLADLHDGFIHVVAGKTGKAARYPLTPDLEAVCNELKAIRRQGKRVVLTEYLICNRRGRAYTKSGFDSMWQKVMREFEKAGHDRFAPSDLRALHASELDERGGDATRNLQHSSRQVTTRHYLRRPQVLTVLERKY